MSLATTEDQYLSTWELNTSKSIGAIEFRHTRKSDDIPLKLLDLFGVYWVTNVKPFDRLPSIWLLAREYIEVSVAKHACWCTRTSFIQVSNRIPGIYGCVINFTDISRRSFSSFRDLSTKCEDKLIKHEDYWYVESWDLHWSFLNHIHVGVYLPAAFRDLAILRHTSQQVNVASLGLNWAESSGNQC